MSPVTPAPRDRGLLHLSLMAHAVRDYEEISGMSHRTIRSVDDLAQLPDEELLACLGALRAAIVEAKRQHAIALREHMIPSGSPFIFPSFNWRPKGQQRLDSPGQLRPDTPIDEIAVRASAREALRDLSIFCIEDLSAISEQELLKEEAIGAKTVGRLREMLARVGLDFLPNPNIEERAHERSKAVLALPSEARALALRGLADSALVSALGLRTSTLSRALANGLETVGQVRRLTLPLLCENFGKREAREIYDLLMATDRPFASSAPPIELWRYGLVTTKELPVPTAPETPINELRPWLGTSVDSLSACGIHTLGALRGVASRGDVASFRGMGRVTSDRVLGFLGAYVTPQPYRRGLSTASGLPA